MLRQTSEAIVRIVYSFWGDRHDRRAGGVWSLTTGRGGVTRRTARYGRTLVIEGKPWPPTHQALCPTCGSITANVRNGLRVKNGKMCPHGQPADRVGLGIDREREGADYQMSTL